MTLKLYPKQEIFMNIPRMYQNLWMSNGGAIDNTIRAGWLAHNFDNRTLILIGVALIRQLLHVYERQVLHVYEKDFPKYTNIRNIVDGVEQFVDGLISEKYLAKIAIRANEMFHNAASSMSSLQIANATHSLVTATHSLVTAVKYHEDIEFHDMGMVYPKDVAEKILHEEVANEIEQVSAYTAASALYGFSGVITPPERTQSEHRDVEEPQLLYSDSDCLDLRRRQNGLMELFIPGPEWQSHWRTSDTSGLAKAIYKEKEWGRCPILADALMDAGCDDPWIMYVLRERWEDCGRGVWILDRLTGRR